LILCSMFRIGSTLCTPVSSTWHPRHALGMCKGIPCKMPRTSIADTHTHAHTHTHTYRRFAGLCSTPCASCTRGGSTASAQCLPLLMPFQRRCFKPADLPRGMTPRYSLSPHLPGHGGTCCMGTMYCGWTCPAFGASLDTTRRSPSTASRCVYVCVSVVLHLCMRTTAWQGPVSGTAVFDALYPGCALIYAIRQYPKAQ